MEKMNADDIIKHFNLSRHMEGGLFHEYYKSEAKVQLSGYVGERHIATSAFFLLRKGDISHFHRIKSDETWHFYAGEALEIIEINKQGQLIKTHVGRDFFEGDTPQYTVKAGNWFAARSLGAFSFVGCTVSPGFDYRDFELASYENLGSLYPSHREIIEEYSYKNA